MVTVMPACSSEFKVWVSAFEVRSPVFSLLIMPLAANGERRTVNGER